MIRGTKPTHVERFSHAGATYPEFMYASYEEWNEEVLLGK